MPGEQPGRAAGQVALGVRPAATAGRCPSVARTGWARNPIDRFILARLEAAGLSPSPEADRRDLAPPAEPRPDRLAPVARGSRRLPGRSVRRMRYERAVDRLLASPHFGERWARPWLDQARYADSNGYNIDAPRSIWKYRDWVIAAFNCRHAVRPVRDRPDRRRPAAASDASAQRIATGFHRNTLINQEGGIDVEQFRVESIVDRVNTTGTVFLGLTIGCAQCHDHKYDPISQREYYRLFAFFNNVDEPDLEIATPRGAGAGGRCRGADRRAPPRAGQEVSRPRRARAAVGEDARTSSSRRRRRPTCALAFDLPREKRSSAQRAGSGRADDGCASRRFGPRSEALREAACRRAEGSSRRWW